MSRSAGFEFVQSAAGPEDFPAPGPPEVALVGRSNVGKSSLLNCLTGARRLAFVSKTPGRTQLINFFRRGNELVLVDLPGYGFARAPRALREKWESLVTGYLFSREALCLVLLLVDMRRDPVESDGEAHSLLKERGLPQAIVATKADKLSKSARQKKLKLLERAYGAAGETPLIPFSAVTLEGRKELWKVIETHARRARRAPKR